MKLSELFTKSCPPANTLFSCIMLVLVTMAINSSIAQVFSVKTDVPMSEEGETSWASSWGDYDNDNDDDLLVSNYYNQNFLYRNNGKGTFTKVINGSIVLSSVGHWASTWIDFDNDRDLDLYVINSYADNNELLRNNGNGTFTSINSAITNTSNSLGNNAAWADTDRDGDLDLFIATGSNSDAETRNKNNLYYINNGNGTFTQNTTSVIATDGGFSQYGTFSDYDGDGDPDLLVINTFQDNFFYENNGDGSFQSVLNKPFLSIGEQPLTACWGDLNNDGHIDLVTGSYAQSRVYFNNGDKSFRTITFPNISGNATGVSLGDFNNDGLVDVVFIRTGQNSLFYLNNGNETFSSINAGDLTSAQLDYTNSGAVADYDKDGDLDIFVNNDNSTNLLFENTEVTNHWIGFRLVGRQSNWQGIGAKVMIKVNNQWQTREIATPSSYRTQNSLVAHFGLGSASCIEQLRILWPSGKIQDINTVRRRNVYLTIDESIDCYDFSEAPLSAITSDGFYSNANAWADYDNDGDLDGMVGNSSLLDETNGINLYQNQADSTFLDVAEISGLGGAGNNSGGTWGDYDNDGDPDLFLTDSSALGNGVLYRNNGGSFSASPMPTSAMSVGAAWADLDADGALDLVVAINQPSENQKPNVLYLGDGNGVLSIHNDAVINSDKGVGSGNVALADIDGDHDTDIFFPTKENDNDLLYRNNGHAKFDKDMAWQQHSAPSSNLNAAFGDYDNDGDADLYVSGDDRLYRNDGYGVFTLVTNTAFSDERSKQALWGDHDNDGDLDLFLVKGSLTKHALYQNEGDGTFTKFESVLTLSEMSTGSASWIDVDNNGYLDLFLANRSNNKLFLNAGGIFNSIRVNLKGIESNKSGIGATIKMKVGTQWQSRQIFSQISGSLQAHFGLGEASSADILRVEWPSGNVQILNNVAANQLITITESNSLNAPHTMSLQLATNEDTHITLTPEIVKDSFIDTDGDKPNSIKLVSSSDKLDLMLNGSAVSTGAMLTAAEFEKLQIRPKQNMNGLAQFDIETTDYRGLVIGGEVLVDIVPVNDEPHLGPLVVTERMGRNLKIEGALKDVDTPLTDLSFTVSSQYQDILKDENISFAIDGEKITFTITASAEGSGVLMVYAHDGDATVFAELRFDINNLPHTMELTLQIDEDESLNIHESDFTTAFKDQDGDQLQKIKLTELPSNGYLVLEETPAFLGQEIEARELDKLHFIPAENFSGTILIDVEVIDTRNLGIHATVNIQVLEVNDTPKLLPISDRNILIEQNFNSVTVSIEASDTDTPPSSLVFSAVSDNQQVISNANLRIENSTLSIIPSAQGEAKIAVTVSDGESSFTTEFTVHVGLVTSIEMEITGKVLLYPNPVTNDQIVIVIPGNATHMISYKIIDARGILVKEQRISLNYECAIPLQDMPPGIYTILFTLESQRVQSIKFVKQ